MLTTSTKYLYSGKWQNANMLFEDWIGFIKWFMNGAEARLHIERHLEEFYKMEGIYRW